MRGPGHREVAGPLHWCHRRPRGGAPPKGEFMIRDRQRVSRKRTGRTEISSAVLAARAAAVGAARLSARRRRRAAGCPAPSHGLRARTVLQGLVARAVLIRSAPAWVASRSRPAASGHRSRARLRCLRAHGIRARLGSAASRACSASVPSRASPALPAPGLLDAEPTARRAVRARRFGGIAQAPLPHGPAVGPRGRLRAAPRSKGPPGAPSIPWRRSQAAHLRTLAARRRPIRTSWRGAAQRPKRTRSAGAAAAPTGG